jgi:Protein of unknown function (DUF3152)
MLSTLRTSMKTVYYTTLVDADVVYDARSFGRDVDIYLSDPEGWESKGYTFVRVERVNNNTVRIHLSSPETIRKAGCTNPHLSCATMNGNQMMLNAVRWTRGASPSQLPLDAYRQYMVSHEMGHILGHDHVKCPGPGQPAPIMMQQTLGIGACSPNTRV